MNNNYLISVIVPVYKVEKYLRKCIDSIIAQTYKNIEIFLVDDGSPDNCGAICDEYAHVDERIKVIHKENGGLSSARNAALDVATGDYVMFVDSDDWVEPDFCYSALEMVLKEGVKMAAFGYNNICYEKDNKRYKAYKRFTKSVRTIGASETIRHIILKDDVIFNFAWNKIYDRQLFEKIRYPYGKTFEDNAVTYLLANKSDKIFVSDNVLYNYVRRNDGISGKWYSPKHIADRFEIWTERLKNIRLVCPENEDMQLKQIANEAVEGIVYIHKRSQYNYVLKDMKDFLIEHKNYLLSHNPSLRVKLYYYAKPLLRIIKPTRNCRNFLRRVNSSFKNIVRK